MGCSWLIQAALAPPMVTLLPVCISDEVGCYCRTASGCFISGWVLCLGLRLSLCWTGISPIPSSPVLDGVSGIEGTYLCVLASGRRKWLVLHSCVFVLPYLETVGVLVFLAPLWTTWSVSDYSDVRGVPLQPGPKVGINFIYNFHWLDKCEHEWS